MEKVTSIEQLLLRSRRMAALVMAVTLAVLAAVIAFATHQVRTRIRAQMAGRDGEILQAVAAMQQEEHAAELALEDSLDDPASQLTVVLLASRLKDIGVMGARLFDANGKFVTALPPTVREADLITEDVSRLRQLDQKSASHFHPAAALSGIFYPERDGTAATGSIPLLEVNVPLRNKSDQRMAGIAQFLIEGHSIAAEYARLDRNLIAQALAMFGAFGAILVAAIGLAFGRLRRAHRLLAERTTNLLQANQELALAAKTSAVGAVTAHLIHGLKNPLTGLQNFVSSFDGADPVQREAHWQQAVASTRRMQTMISQVVNVLREQQEATQYEITLAEMVEIIAGRTRPLAREAGVRFTTRLEAEGVLSNRTANLAALIVVNLVQNAVQATPAGKAVTLAVTKSGGRCVFEVQDEGPGFPEELKKNLFAPCQSSKEGGCGIGLAISQQLAAHLGATLDLKSSSTAGCAFALGLPLTAADEKSERASSAVIG